MENFQSIIEVINWSTEAGMEEGNLAYFQGREVEDGGMGLWQSFQAKFPKDKWVGDYDLAVCIYDSTYKAVAKACYRALSEK